MLQTLKQIVGLIFLHIIAIIIGYCMVRFYSQKPLMNTWEYHERIVATIPSILMTMLTMSYVFECIIKHKQIK